MEGICWPKSTLYNSANEFVGYIMPKASGVSFERLVATPNVPKKRGWDRKMLVECLINIIKLVEYLHKNNVIIGDINEANIMIESCDKVYLVDTDSYQLDRFPCLVEQQIFVDPTVKNNTDEKLAYTIKDDNYRLGSFLFTFLCKSEYSYWNSIINRIWGLACH